MAVAKRHPQCLPPPPSIGRTAPIVHPVAAMGMIVAARAMAVTITVAKLAIPDATHAVNRRQSNGSNATSSVVSIRPSASGSSRSVSANAMRSAQRLLPGKV